MKINKTITSFLNNSLVWVVATLFMASTTWAQTDLPDEPDDLTPAAPIDNYVWILAIIGLAFVLLKLKSYKTTR